ncbi:RidA family protein [Paenibacillus sp. FSL W8-0186]|uniref:RidA family protein n=2 Tax=Paenibacillus sp. FSL W8-0186 TaxID=2921709 RepID=UPI0030CFBDB9
MMMARTYNHGVAWEEGSGISQGYSVNGTIYISGQFSHDMQSTLVGAGDIEAQTRQTLENLDRVLEGFGAAKSNLAYVEIYLTNVKEHFEPCIQLFKQYMGQHRPAGSLIGVTSLAFPEQLIEISAIAHMD